MFNISSKNQGGFLIVLFGVSCVCFVCAFKEWWNYVSCYIRVNFTRMRWAAEKEAFIFIIMFYVGLRGHPEHGLNHTHTEPHPFSVKKSKNVQATNNFNSYKKHQL